MNSVWKGKYKTLKNYYSNAYDKNYYDFDKYELEIDPDETVEEIENYTPAQQHEEIIKCVNSFNYFCHKYVKILHPTYGLIPFILYIYQRQVITDYENYRFNIIRKFRQGGLTTVTLLWGLWRCLFKLDQQVMLLSKTDREATDIGMIVDRAIEYMPTWMKPTKNGKWNDHLKQFTATGGAMRFYSPEAARGKAVTFLIVDEAAFIPDMTTHWKAMWPVLSTGGSCTLVSTVNGIGNWYHEMYVGSTSDNTDRNLFHAIDLRYTMHPDYNNPKWVAEQRMQLGEKGYLQEVLCEFLGSGDTYIKSRILADLTEQCRNNHPQRKLLPNLVNKTGMVANLEGEFEKGALWVWKEPLDAHEYLIGVDVSEGMGENTDNSCFQIIDSVTMEQVAEFYSNEVPTHVLAQILSQFATYYNNALVIVEDMGPGGAVLNALQHTLGYDNLYYDDSKIAKPGLKVNKNNRPLLLQAMQNRLLNDTIKINSIRLVSELQTFLWNATARRAEAAKGKHDDAIMALCIALYIRDSLLRDIPVGAYFPEELTNASKTELYEEIKKELERGLMENLLEEEYDMLHIDMDSEAPGTVFDTRRKYKRLLEEFGWG